jgi:hypothetical protein
MSLSVATNKYKKGETLLTMYLYSFSQLPYTTPSVFGSSDRKWIYFENRVVANYRGGGHEREISNAGR